MPFRKQPASLAHFCTQTVVKSIDTHWLNENSHLKKCLDGHSVPMYLIGPFEALSDESVDLILRSLYPKLNKMHLYILLHNRLTKLDLSFIKKQGLISSSVYKHIGNNLFVSVSIISAD